MRRIFQFNRIETQDIAQKTKVKWTIVGDENTKYFHGILKKKKRQMNIKGVKINGDWVTIPNDVKSEILRFYMQKFEEVPSLEEVRQAVWECDSDKASSPEGFTFSFIKRYWDLMQQDIF